jgi:hypothetical protein
MVIDTSGQIAGRIVTVEQNSKVNMQLDIRLVKTCQPMLRLNADARGIIIPWL